MHYQIIDPGRFDPQDGETHDYQSGSFWRALEFANHDARVMAIDFVEFWRDGATTARDVTEDVVRDGVENGFLPRDCAIAEAIMGEAEKPTLAEQLAYNREMYA